MTATSLGMGVAWVCSVTDWARLQNLLVLMRARIGVGQVELGLGTAEPCTS